MRVDDEWKKIQAFDQLNHLLGLGSFHPDILKFSTDITKMENEEGALLHSLAKTLILFNYLNMVTFSPGSVNSWTQRLNEC